MAASCGGSRGKCGGGGMGLKIGIDMGHTAIFKTDNQ